MTEAAHELNLQIGDTVHSSDDHKVGTVKAFDAYFMTVEHGLLLKSEYYIPTAAINHSSAGAVYLTATKDEVGNSGWDSPPLIVTDAGDPPLLHE